MFGGSIPLINGNKLSIGGQTLTDIVRDEIFERAMALVPGKQFMDAVDCTDCTDWQRSASELQGAGRCPF